MRQETSFGKIAEIIYSLLGIIPYLLIVYLATRMHVNVTQTILMIAAGALISHLLGFSIMRRFGQQLQTFSEKTGLAVTALKKTPIEIKGNQPRELSDIALHFNTMLAEAEKSNRNYQEVTTKLMLYARDIEDYQQQLRKEALLRQQLSRYVGDALVEQIMRSDQGRLLQNRKQETTVLFADIRSFTTLSEHMPPEKVIDILNDYFDNMVDIIFEHHGILDKFVGDELMAVFGLIGPSEEEGHHAVHAVRAATAMQDRIKTLMPDFAAKGYPVFDVGIGINTGETVVGNVGSKNRMDYTVIGDTVNVAARLEQMAEGRTIIIGEETRKCCGTTVDTTSKGEIKVKNRAKPVRCFQVIG
ncbi:MAG: adenylate/guanylate cyclase domain-containing protein [Mariprofundaceae bacterium]|nr:adenylate/guanylate cyclase domain-containing protein [Mariprofundaceae bacterium]